MDYAALLDFSNSLTLFQLNNISLLPRKLSSGEVPRGNCDTNFIMGVTPILYRVMRANVISKIWGNETSQMADLVTSTSYLQIRQLGVGQVITYSWMCNTYLNDSVQGLLKIVIHAQSEVHFTLCWEDFDLKIQSTSMKALQDVKVCISRRFKI